MALTILIRSGAAEGPPGITFDAPRIVIGRGEGCEVRLPDPSVSHRHASIRQRGSEYILLDEGSTNGTFVGPVRLSPQAPRIVRDGDLIRIGRIWLEARVEHAPATQNTPIATRELALALVGQALAAQGESGAVRLTAVEGPSQGRTALVEEFERAYVVGRGKTVELSLDDPDLSRRHVEVIRRADRVFVKDLGSKNGSLLGDEPLAENKETVWPLGKPLIIGAHRITYDDPLRAALDELERAADEKLRANEPIDPPTHDRPEVAATDHGATLPESKPAAPVARRPERAIRPSGSGWTATDVLVAMIALVVLAMSVAGLVWLIGSG